eukprot:TRINITY_DN8103_c1_g2_i1.p1 TRINITY_DN8103_c1_g2~~TRINITY_DN8103_c1_g2_i1.p1  ORF type:complete len:754 (+),score=99.60 TRINITY_DN8103_c1_g2_i1:62-2323(+)
MRNCLLVLVCSAAPCFAAGGVKLWELGDRVEQNPITVFSMFVLTVVLTVIVELAKHYVEHRTQDPHRKEALGAIYAELMLVGIVSFLLILAAEAGLTDLEVRKPGCDSGGSSEADSANSSASGCPVCPSSSGSGSADPCIIGFDILMFEYAHLVLFFMGITYCTFIQICFMQRNRYCAEIADLETYSTLAGWFDVRGYRKPSVRGCMGIRTLVPGTRDFRWAVSLLMLRGTIVLHHEEKLRSAAHSQEHILERTLAKLQGKPLPGRRPAPDEVQVCFSMARFTHRAFSEVLVELLHVPPAVWLAVVFMCSTNLSRTVGLDLTQSTLLTASLGPMLALVLLWKLSTHFVKVARGGVGHPRQAAVEFVKARGKRMDLLPVPAGEAARGKEWAETGSCPWDDLEGCIPDDSAFNRFDLMDPGALKLQIQVVVFALCFFVGQLVMLSTGIVNTSGSAGLPLVVCLWILPVIPLGFVVPRAILIYALIHRTAEVPVDWLLHAVREDPPAGTAHGHSAQESCVDKCRQDAIEELLSALTADSSRETSADAVRQDSQIGTPDSKELAAVKESADLDLAGPQLQRKSSAPKDVLAGAAEALLAERKLRRKAESELERLRGELARMRCPAPSGELVTEMLQPLQSPSSTMSRQRHHTYHHSNKSFDSPTVTWGKSPRSLTQAPLTAGRGRTPDGSKLQRMQSGASRRGRKGTVPRRVVAGSVLSAYSADSDSSRSGGADYLPQQVTGNASLVSMDSKARYKV